MDFDDDVLTERYAHPVIRFMHGNDGKVKFSDLKHIVNNYPTLEKLMKRLSDEGVVVVTRVLKPYKTNYAELTDLGWRVAGKLVAASKILAGEEPEQETNYDLSPQGRGAVKHGGDE